MSMEYRVVYLEDESGDSVVSDLIDNGIEATHCPAAGFQETVDRINDYNPDLILMDYRLLSGGGAVNAPSFAQNYRSLAIDSAENHRNMPIVLMSNDNAMVSYHKDVTSHDLFDFSIKKSKFSDNKAKYATLIKELIDSYKKIQTLPTNGDLTQELLAVPVELVNDLDRRVTNTLEAKSHLEDPHMLSAFILDQVVKPIGLLIGEDVLSARLGVCKTSGNWGDLLEDLDEFKYSGIYSGTYKRWWAVGLEHWWRTKIDEGSHPKRLKASVRLAKIKETFPGLDLLEIQRPSKHPSEKFWTICQKSFDPLDPNLAFEVAASLPKMPWVDFSYYSYESVRGDDDLLSQLKEQDKERYKDLARG